MVCPLNKVMKFNKKLSALLCSAVLAVTATVMPVMAAATPFTYTPISGSTVNFAKYLVMDEQANVPNATMTFSIAAGTGKDATATTMKVIPGPMTGTTAPSISDVTFAPGDATNTTVQTADTGFVTLDSGEKYAKKDATVNLAGVTFNEPGIYRYVITEEPSADNAAKGITNDAANTRILDVYITSKADKTLELAGYVLHTSADDVAMNATAGSDGANPEGKNKGFCNEYETEDLTLSKDVAGNQASYDKYFKFTVAISNAVAGTVYDVDLSNAEAAPAATASTIYSSMTNPDKLTAGADGTVSADFYLQHGQKIVIKGLAKNTSYSITEAEEDYKPATATTEGTAAAVAGTTNNVRDDAITANTTVAYTNNRTGVVPTGIMVGMLPYAALAGAAAAGIFASRKKKEDKEDK